MKKEKKNLWMDIFNLFDKENKGFISIQVLYNYLTRKEIIINVKKLKRQRRITFEELNQNF